MSSHAAARRDKTDSDAVFCLITLDICFNFAQYKCVLFYSFCDYYCAVSDTLRFHQAATWTKMPGRRYVSGWSCRLDSGRAVRRPTIRDSGYGSARTITYRRSADNEDQSYEAIKAGCLDSGSLWEDPDFPPARESLFYHTAPSAWPDIDWKRPHVRSLVVHVERLVRCMSVYPNSNF